MRIAVDLRLLNYKHITGVGIYCLHLLEQLGELKKTKNVNIGNSSSTLNTNQASEDKGSTISISELKDLQNENMPSRTKRKPKSEKNTISLDI